MTEYKNWEFSLNKKKIKKKDMQFHQLCSTLRQIKQENIKSWSRFKIVICTAL